MFWLIIFGISFIIEITTLSLVSIWFSAGSLMAMLIGYFRLPFIGQVLGFTITSLMTFLVFRPILMKHIESPKTKTNMDRNIGETGEVTKEIGPLSFGQVKVNNQIWTARSMGETTLLKGTMVEVVGIEGVKLVVVESERGNLEWDGSF